MNLLFFTIFFVQLWDWLNGGSTFSNIKPSFLTLKGYIKPSSTRQITNTICNKLEIANYTFGFKLENSLPLGGYLELTFPSQYPADLGLNTLNPLKCSHQCTQSGRQIKFYFTEDIKNNTGYNVTIERIVNPSFQGGTGNFWLRTVKGGQTIDENLIFGVLGIANDIGKIVTSSVGLDTEGVQFAGELSRYVFIIETSRYIPSNNFVRLYLPPDEFEIVQFPTCSAYPVAGKTVNGRLICESFENNYIDVRGFVDEFVKGTSIGIVVTVRNPAFAHITTEFGVAILRDFTQIMYDRKLDIPGVTITPGLISDIEILQLDKDLAITRNKLMKFQLRFKVSNKLKEGSIIKFTFPASLKIYNDLILGIPNSYWVDFGLEDKSEADALATELDVNNDLLYIKNYKYKEDPDLIVLKFWATTPDNAGESSPVVIQSLTDVDGTYIIDQDDDFAKITVTDVGVPDFYSLVLSEDFAGLNRTVDITFTLIPGISIPAKGFIKVIFDNSLVINEVDVNKCQIWDTASAKFVDALTCYKRNREISIQLKDEQYTAANTYFFKFEEVVESPTVGGKFLVDVTSYQVDGSSKLESYTQIITFRSAQLVFPLINLYPKERYEKSILDLQFSVPFVIPHSRPQNITTETVSFINVGIEPSGPTSLQTDLGYTAYGTGLLPCYAVFGLEPVDGSQINCTIITGEKPSVRITNYHQIPAGTRIRILIAEFTNPDGNFISNIQIMRKFNRRLTEMTSIKETLQITDGSTIPPSNDFTSIDRNTFYSANVTEVNNEFEISYNMRSQAIVNGNEKLIVQFPNYDNGFVMLDKQPKCFVNDLPFTCFAIPHNDWILIEIASFESIAVSNDVVMKFTGLRWPRIEKPFPGSLIMRQVTSTKDLSQVYVYSEFLKATPSLFTKISLVQDKKRQGAIDARYTFKFTTKTGIPDGGSIIMTFPSEYNLVVSSPKVRVSYPDFKNSISNGNLSYFYTANQLKISGIGDVPINSAFRIIFNGLRNPSYEGVMSTFFMDTQYQDFSLSRQDNFVSISLDKVGTPGIIEIKSMTVLPTNADAKADYIFVIQPKIKLSVGSEIHITFPDEYKTLPSPLICDVSGGMKTFESCLQSFNSVVMRIDLDYAVAQGPFTIIVRDVVNPDAGITQPFEIFSKYDSATLEYSDPALSASRQVNIAPKAATISIVESDLNPQNEAELSTYTISFLPTNDIGFSQEIIFIFPRSYDKSLGINVACSATSGIVSDISCNRLVDRRLYIDGIESYQVSPERPITIEISGIINPNRGATDEDEGISIAILKSGETAFIDYIEDAIKIVPLKAPGWAFFYSIIESNANCRYTADYTLNFTATASIPKLSSQGAIILDLPPQFNIISKIIKTESFSTQFGTALNSEVKRNRVWIEGNTNDFSGNMKLKIKQIDNPLDEILTDNFIIRTYDGVNKKIIERSFENLDPHYKTYTYPGPLIIINKDLPIVVGRGTQSAWIPVEIQGIAALNLTLIPTTPGFDIIPFQVPIQIGQAFTYFRISVAADFSEGDYEITWEVRGELIPRIYTPTKPTPVTIERISDIPISIESISEIPFGGTSMPVFFRIDKAPDIGFNIILNLKKEYAGILLSTNSLNFDAGVTEASFRVFYNDTNAASEEGLTEGFIDMQLFGVNKDLYLMPFNTLQFNIITQEVVAPVITAITQNSVGKIDANFTVTASEPCYVYWAVALSGTVTPNKTEMILQGPAPYPETQTQYGLTYIYDSLSTKFNVKNILPQTQYILYVLLVDRGSRNSEFSSLKFVTRNRDNAADVSIKLKQSYISAYDRRQALDMVALVLSLPRENVIESKYSFSAVDDSLNGQTRLLEEENTKQKLEEVTLPNTHKNRILQPFGTGLEKAPTLSLISDSPLLQVNVLLTFNIVPVLTSATYPDPKEMGSKLNQEAKKIQLNSRIDNFDDTYIIPSSEFLVYNPSFVTPPFVQNVNYQNVTIRSRMNNFGFIYAVATERNSTEQRSGQLVRGGLIQRGLDSEARTVPSGWVEIEEAYKYYDIEINFLEPSTDYTIWVIGANAHPGNPDLMQDKFISDVNVTTEPAPPIEILDLGGGILKIGWTMMIAFVVLVVFGDVQNDQWLIQVSFEGQILFKLVIEGGGQS